MAGNNGGPWGSGGGGGGGDNRGGNRGNNGQRPGGDGSQIPEIDEIVRKGQEQLRVLMGGRGGRGPRGPRSGGGGPAFSGRTVLLGLLGVLALWVFASFYTVRPEERGVELMFGSYHRTTGPGLNFAPWPVVTAEIVQVTGERVTDIGTGRGGRMDSGLMLTRDEAVVDIEFQVVWNIERPDEFLFNLADAGETVRAVSDSAMRDIIARSELSPILNRDRGAIAQDLLEAIQATLDTYQSGINVIRINFDRADPPGEVIDSFREVQAARQQRDRLEREADAYANRVLAGARGEAAQILEQSEGYRAEVINAAQGEASRFVSVYTEYVNAPEVTRRRMYLETMERVLGGMDKVILDGVTGDDAGGGVLPYLPLNELRRGGN
ncbi:FtsH protease activity modulator HflK [Halodurantibacterium flavum]|uniref:Protein HflK n=1 Tax=Halodurantibacterium flavum TaxID=1382802 RepID=A0ABW4S3S9_9RHOB